MNLIITNIDELFDKLEVEYKLRYENKNLNQSINCFRLLDENELKIIENNLGIDLKTILYSKYYWFNEFMRYHKQQYGNDYGIEQKQFRLLEEIDQQLCEGVDLSIIKEIDELMFK